MNRLIVSLDMLPNDALALAQAIYDKQQELEQALVWGFKLNTLIIHDGCHIVNFLNKKNFRVMADLKFNDDPDIMDTSIKTLDLAGADIITTSLDALYIPNERGVIDKSKLAGVSTLASTFTYDIPLKFSSSRAVFAQKSGYNYIVCLPEELPNMVDVNIKKICTEIYPKSYDQKDNRDTLSEPKNAVINGAHLIIVGRPILSHKNPIEAILEINEELGYI